MHEKARENINRALERGIAGSNRECKYFPCHKDEKQDCTFCFCAFYPCLDNLTGGRFKISSKTGKRVWSCIACSWIHRGEVSKTVLEEIKKISYNIGEIDSEKLKEIRLKIIRR